MADCPGCGSVTPQRVYWEKNVTITSVSRSKVGFYINGSLYPSRIYYADWASLEHVCPRVSIYPSLEAHGPAYLSETWLRSNSLPVTGDQKHPRVMAAPSDATFERKRVIVGAEWTVVAFEGESDSPVFWLPDGVLADRDEPSYTFGLVVTGFSTPKDPAAQAALRLKAIREEPRTDLKTPAVRGPVSEADWSALSKRRLIVLDRKYDFTFIDSHGKPLATIPLSPTVRQDLSARHYPDVSDTTTTQYIYINSIVETNNPVLR